MGDPRESLLDEAIVVSGANVCGCDEGGVATPGIEGRMGADDYAIAPEEWDKPPLVSCDVLYCMGGVYGNQEAMKTIQTMAAEETGEVCVVYNGDYHWFDGTAENFQEVERLLNGCIPLNGNVELELAREEECGVGCGCSYPTTMSDNFVGRSNAIHARMKESISQVDGLADLLANRPAWAVVDVHGMRVGITHGDERSVSGWGCSVDSLKMDDRLAELEDFFDKHDIDVLSTTHTCAAAAVALDGGVVINNGSAGLPEYKGRLYGLVTRIAATQHPDALYRAEIKGVFVEAVPVRYNHEAFIEWFDGLWPAGSPAAESYGPRAIAGPDVEIEDAVLGGFTVLA